MIGCERISAEQSAISVCGYKEIKISDKLNEFLFFLESKGQNTEKEILIKGYKNILRRLSLSKELIDSIPDNTKDLEGKLLFNNLELNIVGLIVEYIEEIDDVEFFGYNIETPLKNNIIIKYKIKKNSIKYYLNKSLKYWDNIFNKLLKNN